jgi:hypothetical protein
MKRLFLGIALLATASLLGGCPIYSGQQQGEYEVCSPQACYSCPTPSYSNACTAWSCQSDADCPQNYICDPNQLICLAPSTDGGSQDAEAGGDCTMTGCPSGQTCYLANGTAQCVVLGEDGSTQDSSPAGDAGDAGDASDSSASDGGDASDASDASPPPSACNADSDCGGNGAKCVNGTCASQVHLCSDGSQCDAQGFSCVDGICEPQCSASTPCPTGYQCDLTRGVCNINPDACSGSGASSCLGGTTCVDGHCVPPCSTSDASPACPATEVCANGGCIPNQAASFACSNDGESGSLATTCPASDVCVHHDCYVECTSDGGECTSTGSADVCKNVTIETGTYSVCGTTTTLGSQCDPSQGNYCASGKVCVNGYCE